MRPLTSKCSPFSKQAPQTIAPSAEYTRASRVIWFILGMTLLLDIAWVTSAGFSVDLSSRKLLAIILVLLAIGMYYFHNIRQDAQCWHLLRMAFIILVYMPIAAVFSYLCGSTGLPLRDELFIAIDKALGFDWLSHVQWVAEHEHVSTWLKFSYTFFLPQLAIVILLLPAFRQYMEIQRFILVLMLSLMATIIISGLMPAVAGYVYYDLDPDNLLNPAAARLHEEHFFALRDGSMRVFMLSQMKGIITFPSFHVTAALLLIYVSRLHILAFIPSLIINTSMMISAMSHGGHWLADVIGGLVVGWAAIAAANRITRPRAVEQSPLRSVAEPANASACSPPSPAS